RPNAGRDIAEEVSTANVVCGASTARALELECVSATLERFSASAALTAVPWRAGDRVLIPRAAEGRDELVDGLRARGVEVDAPIAYRTIAMSAAFKSLHH